LPCAITPSRANSIVPGHGRIGTRKELAGTRAHLETLGQETRTRDAMGMSPGRAAADISLGRFADWTNPERNASNTVRLYAECAGSLKPRQDLAAPNAAVAEYQTIPRSR
jgi:hypothetical protein